MSSAYALHSPVFLTGQCFGLSFVREASREERERTVDFHVISGDYFGTLATIIGLVGDVISDDELPMKERCLKTLEELREDLIYLQQNYQIERK
jgi:hypothetical protein